MTKLKVVVQIEKCQGYGACIKAAPDVFRLNNDGKAEFAEYKSAPDEVVLTAARCCPYRAIAVTDTETGAQIVPRVRAKP